MNPELKLIRQAQRRDFYSKWDWNKNDVDLAKENNLTRERIRQIRLFMGIPQPEKKKHHCNTYHYIKQDKVKYAELFKEHSAQELAKILSVTYPTVYRWAKEFGFKIAENSYPRKYPWELFDWNLPSCDLARIWGIPHQPLISNRRKSMGKPQALYDVRTARTQQDYLDRIEKQKELAKQYKEQKQMKKINLKTLGQPTLIVKMDMPPMRRAMLDIMKTKRIPFDYQKAKEVVESVTTMPFFYVNDDTAGFAGPDNTMLSDGSARETSLDEVMAKLTNWETSIEVPNSYVEVRVYASGNIRVGNFTLDKNTTDALYLAETKMRRKIREKARWANRKAQQPVTS